jgi:hypothetical protein
VHTPVCVALFQEDGDHELDRCPRGHGHGVRCNQRSRSLCGRGRVRGVGQRSHVHVGHTEVQQHKQPRRVSAAASDGSVPVVWPERGVVASTTHLATVCHRWGEPFRCSSSKSACSVMLTCCCSHARRASPASVGHGAGGDASSCRTLAWLLPKLMYLRAPPAASAPHHGPCSAHAAEPRTAQAAPPARRRLGPAGTAPPGPRPTSRSSWITTVVCRHTLNPTTMRGADRVVRSLLVAVVVALALAARARAYTVTLGPKVTSCFYQDTRNLNERIAFTFAVRV